jgi:CHAT domain-containing protein/tetratricopeptide (TPR) repeat protein
MEIATVRIFCVGSDPPKNVRSKSWCGFLFRQVTNSVSFMKYLFAPCHISKGENVKTHIQQLVTVPTMKGNASVLLKAAGSIRRIVPIGLVCVLAAPPATGAVSTLAMPASSTQQTEQRFASNQSARQTTAVLRELELGTPVERDLSGGQSHSYRILLAAGQYLHVVVDQRGIDVVVALYGPDGRALIEIDSPNGAYGPEPLWWIGDATGAYRIEVRSPDSSVAPGKYEVEIKSLCSPQSPDIRRVEAEKMYASGLSLLAKRKEESIRAAIGDFSSAHVIWHDVGEEWREAVTLTQIGAAFNTLDEKQKELEYHGKALPIYQETGDLDGEATCLDLIGAAYYSLGQKSRALESYREALSVRRRVPDLGAEATILNNLGVLSSSVGDKRKALEYQNQALTLYRQTGDRRGEATTLANIGGIYDSLGDRGKALDYYNKALPIFGFLQINGRVAGTLNNIALVYNAIGEGNTALKYFNQALEKLRAEPGSDLFRATVRNNVGNTYLLLGDYRSALKYYEDALKVFRAAKDLSAEAHALNNIAEAHESLGEKQEAMDYYGRALPLARQLQDPGLEATVLNNTGHLYSALGVDDRALANYLRALPLRIKAGDRSGEATTLSSIGYAYESLGDRKKALEYYLRALPVRRQVKDRSGESVTLNNIGGIYGRFGERRKELEYYNEALKIAKLGGYRNEAAVTLNNIAEVHFVLGEKEKALAIYEGALGIFKAVGNRDGEASALVDITLVLRDLGRIEEARDDIEKAAGIVDSIRAEIAGRRWRLSYTALSERVYSAYLDLLMQMHQRKVSAGYDRIALMVSERSRARGLMDLLNEAEAGISQGVDEEILERRHSVGLLLDAKAERLTRLLSTNNSEDEIRATKEEIGNLTEEYEKVEAEIREKSPRYASLIGPPVLSLETIQKLLDPNTLLLEYRLGPRGSYLWAVTNGSYNSYVLPKDSEIEPIARQFYELLRSPGSFRKGRRASQRSVPVSVAGSAGSVGDLSQRLSVMLLAPAASVLGGKRIVIVPDGFLQYLPFAALANPLEKSKCEPLILDHEISILPSASVLAIQRRHLDTRKAVPKTAVVVADPVFSADDPRVRQTVAAREVGNIRTVSADEAQARFAEAGGAADPTKPALKDPVSMAAPDPSSVHGKLRQAISTATRQDAQVYDGPSESLYRLALTRAVKDTTGSNLRHGLSRLPGTRVEGTNIVALSPDDSKLIVDFAASRAAVEDADLGQYKYVHFATHGLLEKDTSDLSGLVLSLVDDQGRRQNGYLRAFEIFNLNLSAEVVTLSACQTGLGKDVRGEGLVGLTQAFMYAGAKRVVMSLWSVDDASTAALMTSFYHGMLKEGKRPAEALRAAQIEMLTHSAHKQWQSPYYWAPFIIEGDWR